MKDEIKKLLADFDDDAFDTLGKFSWDEIKSKHADKILQLLQTKIDSAEDEIHNWLLTKWLIADEKYTQDIINIIKERCK